VCIVCSVSDENWNTSIQSCGSGFIESGSSISSESGFGYGYGYGSNPDSGCWWPKTLDKKKYRRKFLKIFFGSKIAIYLCPRDRRSL
jgi:hypothetical protein